MSHTIGSKIGPETSHKDDDGDADAEDNYLAIVNKNGDKGMGRDEDPLSRVSLGIRNLDVPGHPKPDPPGPVQNRAQDFKAHSLSTRTIKAVLMPGTNI